MVWKYKAGVCRHERRLSSSTSDEDLGRKLRVPHLQSQHLRTCLQMRKRRLGFKYQKWDENCFFFLNHRCPGLTVCRRQQVRVPQKEQGRLVRKLTEESPQRRGQRSRGGLRGLKQPEMSVKSLGKVHVQNKQWQKKAQMISCGWQKGLTSIPPILCRTTWERDRG